MKDHEKNPAGLEGLSESFDLSAKPIITVDVEKYQSYLDDTAMTDAEKKEFLQALWQVIVGFVELGFGVHPLQEVCGKLTDTDTQPAGDGRNGLCSEQPDIDNDIDGLSP